MLQNVIQRIRPGKKPSAPPAVVGRRSTADSFAEEQAERAERLQERLAKDAERNQHLRQDERSAFSVIAELSLPDKGFSIDGVVTEASRGGLSFRPAANYIEERTGEHIQIVAQHIRRNGVIRSTRVNGYGIQLLEQLSDSDLEALKAMNVNLAQAEFADGE